MDADLVWERPTIDAYEASFMDPPVGFWTELVPRPLRCWGGRNKHVPDRQFSDVAAEK